MPNVANDWTKVRYELDKSENFEALCNSPWYSDAVYDKFSPEEFARRHQLARELMARDGFDALILCGSPNIYSHGSGVTWGCGLIDDRGLAQYMVLPLKGEPTLIYPHPGCHIEAVRKMVSIADVRSGQHGHYGRAVAERLIELGLPKGRIGITAADRTGPEFMGVNAYLEMKKHVPEAEFTFVPMLMHELSYIKTPEEIRAMAKAGELAMNALRAVAARAKPGVREYQLAAAATHAVMDGGGRVHLLMIGSTSMYDPKLIFPNPNPSHRILQQGDIILCELAMTYMGYTAKVGHPVSIGQPTERYNRFHKDVVVPGFRAIEAQLAPGRHLEELRKSVCGVFRERGAQSRPILMHGHDLITSLPFIMTDEVKGAPFDMVMKPGMAYGIEITPVSADGTYGIFFSRSYAITETGVQSLTPYPADDILVAG
jgi:Xaa-Pro aminopeptidase